MSRAKTKKRASLAMDAIMAAGLTVLLAGMFSAAIVQYGRAVRLDDARGELRRAAETELLKLRSGGPDVARETPTPAAEPDLGGAISLETELTAGAGEWSGMTRATVRASRPFEGGRLRVELSAYLPATEVRP